jgi:hypothetical protein
MRKLAAENMLLQQQLEVKKHLFKMLKKESMLQITSLPFCGVFCLHFGYVCNVC